jgi:hypothetical protein
VQQTQAGEQARAPDVLADAVREAVAAEVAQHHPQRPAEENQSI